MPVTAHDFVFAWRRIVTPATLSHYAGILFPIKNAQRISRGELPPSAMGHSSTDASGNARRTPEEIAAAT